jgi:hypothetical protein
LPRSTVHFPGRRKCSEKNGESAWSSLPMPAEELLAVGFQVQKWKTRQQSVIVCGPGSSLALGAVNSPGAQHVSNESVMVIVAEIFLRGHQPAERRPGAVAIPEAAEEFNTRGRLANESPTLGPPEGLVVNGLSTDYQRIYVYVCVCMHMAVLWFGSECRKRQDSSQ